MWDNLQNKSMVADRSETVALRDIWILQQSVKILTGFTAGKSFHWQVPHLPDGLKPGFQHLSWQTSTKQPRSYLAWDRTAWHFILMYRNTGGTWPFRFHCEQSREEVERWNNSCSDSPFDTLFLCVTSRKHLFDVWNWGHEIFAIFVVFFEMAQLNAEGKFEIPVAAPLIIFSRFLQFKRTRARAGCQRMQSSNLIILSSTVFDVQVGGSVSLMRYYGDRYECRREVLRASARVSGLQAAVWTGGHLRVWQLAPLNSFITSSFQPCRKKWETHNDKERHWHSCQKWEY